MCLLALSLVARYYQLDAPAPYLPHATLHARHGRALYAATALPIESNTSALMAAES